MEPVHYIDTLMLTPSIAMLVMKDLRLAIMGSIIY
jgi:hypothetical protein